MLWGFFLQTPDAQTVLEGYFYVGMSLRSLHWFNIFWCKSCFYYRCLPPLFSVYAGSYPFDIGDVIGVAVTRACPAYLVGTPLCSVVVTALFGSRSAP